MKLLLFLFTTIFIWGVVELSLTLTDEETDEESESYYGTLLIENSTSSTVHVFIDYNYKVKIRPGRSKLRTLYKGRYLLIAYDAEGHIIGRKYFYIDATMPSTWSIGE
jgi:hypothetical protein